MKSPASGKAIADALIAAGTVRIDGSEYVGIAADGVEVSLGTVGEEPRMYLYLEAHPTPDTW